MKTGKLSDVEKTYIETKWKKLSVDDFCKALGRGARIIKSYIGELEQAEQRNTEESKTFRQNDPRIAHTRARSENNKKIIGAISGKTFSELGDDFAKALPKKSPYSNKAIRKIKE